MSRYGRRTNVDAVSAVEQDDLQALEALKSTQETLTFSLQNELKDLQNRYKNLDAQYQQQKSQLIEALVSKDELHRRKLEEQQDAATSKQLSLEEDKRKKDLEEMERKNEEVRRHAVSTSSPSRKPRTASNSKRPFAKAISSMFSWKRSSSIRTGFHAFKIPHSPEVKTLTLPISKPPSVVGRPDHTEQDVASFLARVEAENASAASAEASAVTLLAPVHHRALSSRSALRLV